MLRGKNSSLLRRPPILRPELKPPVTFPTDTKLAAKIVQGVVKMAGLHGVKLRQIFERTVPKLLAADQRRSGRLL